MKKLVILDACSLSPGDLSWSALERLADVTIYDRTPAELVVERIGDAEMILLSKVLINETVLAACPNLEYIGVLATGYNNIDLAACAGAGVTVTNIPAYSTDSVAQFVFALLLEIYCRVAHHAQAVADGRWTAAPDFCFWDYPLRELAGKEIGIIGYGQTGSAVAKIAQAFGMQVLVYARRPVLDSTIEQVSLDELLERSDVVTLHVPLTAETKGLICRETLVKMKPTAVLINTARGPVVQEADVAVALQNQTLGYYAADVVSVEPIQEDNPLLQAPNCLLTPHIAWATTEARTRLMKIAEENLAAYLAGNPQNVIK